MSFKNFNIFIIHVDIKDSVMKLSSIFATLLLVNAASAGLLDQPFIVSMRHANQHGDSGSAFWKLLSLARFLKPRLGLLCACCIFDYAEATGRQHVVHCEQALIIMVHNKGCPCG